MWDETSGVLRRMDLVHAPRARGPVYGSPTYGGMASSLSAAKSRYPHTGPNPSAR